MNKATEVTVVQSWSWTCPCCGDEDQSTPVAPEGWAEDFCDNCNNVVEISTGPSVGEDERCEREARVAAVRARPNHGNTGTCVCPDCENVRWGVRWGFRSALAATPPQDAALAEAVRRCWILARSLESDASTPDCTKAQQAAALRTLLSRIDKQDGWVAINDESDLPKGNEKEQFLVRHVSDGSYLVRELRQIIPEYFSHYRRIDPPTNPSTEEPTP